MTVTVGSSHSSRLISHAPSSSLFRTWRSRRSLLSIQRLSVWVHMLLLPTFTRTFIVPRRMQHTRRRSVVEGCLVLSRRSSNLSSILRFSLCPLSLHLLSSHPLAFVEDSNFVFLRSYIVDL